jgi:hypothetical protein
MHLFFGKKDPYANRYLSPEKQLPLFPPRKAGKHRIHPRILVKTQDFFQYAEPPAPEFSYVRLAESVAAATLG